MYFNESYFRTWIACRHHVLEIALCNATKIVFGSYVHPKIEYFNFLSHTWTTLDLEKLTFHMMFGENVSQQHASEARSKLMSIFCNHNSYIPPNDYRVASIISLLHR